MKEFNKDQPIKIYAEWDPIKNELKKMLVKIALINFQESSMKVSNGSNPKEELLKLIEDTANELLIIIE